MSLRTKIAIAFAIVYIVWGSTYLAIRIGLESMPPFLMASVRFLTAGSILWAFCDVRREPRPTVVQARNAGMVGLLLVTLGNGLVTLGEKSVPSGVTAVILAIGPVFTVLLGWAIGTQERPGRTTWAGLLLGVAGVGLLMSGGAGGPLDPLGVVLLLLATFSWSCGVLASRSRELPVSALRSNSVQMLVGGAAMLAVGLGRGEALHPERVSLSSALALGYLIAFGAILAYSAYAWLLREVSAASAGTNAYVNPAVAMALGALWGEKIGGVAVVAMAAIFAGVWLLRRESSVAEPKPPRTVPDAG